ETGTRAVATSTPAVLVDFNGDGILDVVTADSAANLVSLYSGSGALGVGDGTLFAASKLPLPGTNPRPRSPAVGDLNADGIPDFVVSDTQNNQIVSYLGQAGGGYVRVATA